MKSLCSTHGVKKLSTRKMITSTVDPFAVFKACISGLTWSISRFHNRTSGKHKISCLELAEIMFPREPILETKFLYFAVSAKDSDFCLTSKGLLKCRRHGVMTMGLSWHLSVEKNLRKIRLRSFSKAKWFSYEYSWALYFEIAIFVYSGSSLILRIHFECNIS